MGGKRLATLAWLCAAAALLAATPASAQARPQRTLVIGMSAETAWAHAFEQQMTERLRAAGMDAVPLSQVELAGLRELPADEAQQAIDTLVVNHGFDAVLVGHLSSAQVEIAPYEGEVRLFTPWLSHPWGGWWYGLNFGFPYFGYVAPAIDVQQHWRVEARLFQTRDDQPLWSMVLNTSVDPTWVLPTITQTALEQLWRQGLLPQR